MFKKWAAAPVVVLATLTVISTVAVAGTRFRAPEPRRSFDPVYNVCRGVDPECYNEWYTERDDKVLVFSRTAGPRHANLGRSNILDPDDPSNAGLDLDRPYVITHDHTDPTVWPLPLDDSNVVQNEMIRMLEAEGIEVHITEDVQALEQVSSSYKAVIFASPTRDALWNHASGAEGGTRLDRARKELKQYIQGGGGFVAIHNAHGTEYGWPWYEGLLGNSNYYSHGANQTGDVVIINDRDVSTKSLPERWTFEDEWYNLVPFPTNVNFLAVVDEDTMPEGPARADGHPGHGDFHPVTWCQYYDGGRSWVTTLGHNANSFQESSDGPGAAEFQTMLVSGVKSAMGLEPFCTPERGGRGRR
jgi:type 1 glutamine amidotransferase